MKIKVYASLSYEQLFEKGKKSGMDDKAADYFAHFEEIELELHVDAENGVVCGAEITQKF